MLLGDQEGVGVGVGRCAPPLSSYIQNSKIRVNCCNLKGEVNVWFTILQPLCSWISVFISEESKETRGESKSMQEFMFES